MAKRWKVLGVVGAVLIGVALAVVGGGQYLASEKWSRHVAVAVDSVPIPHDAASIERGKYLFLSRGCASCHGDDGGSREFINDGKGMRLVGPNITRGGATVAYLPQDWARVIRHGVKPKGQPALIMPSEDYNALTDADVGAIAAFVQSLPPQAGDKRVIEFPLLVKLLYAFGAVEDAAEKIDHGRKRAPPVASGLTVEHGAYVAAMCIGCHGPGYSGGKIPGTPPEWPAAANLTPGSGSVMPRYPDEQSFVAMLRSGKRPDGTAIPVMPFESLSRLDDTDAQAIYLYLKALPPRPAGQR